MHPWILRNLIYRPVRAMAGDRIWRLMAELSDTERMSRAALDQRTHALLDGLLRRAYRGSAHFRDRLAAAGYSPQEGYESGMFQRIPPLTKAEVRAYMAAGGHPPVRAARRSTSGSTGEPLVFVKDRMAANYMDAAMHQAYGWFGIAIGDREGRFWGRAVAPHARLKQQIRDRMLNRRRLSAFAMDDASCDWFWRLLRRFRPQYFYCYPSAVYEFADFLQRTGQNGRELELKAIICTGEVLFPHHQALLREVFGCPIVNEYGSTENGIIAFSCPAGNMHVLAQNIFLEVVDEAGHRLPPGTAGRLLVTELHSTHVPFIRYALGDTGTLGDARCGCGRSYPLLSIETGRIDSFIVTPAGRKVYDAILAYTFKSAFRKFQGRQPEIDLLEVDYVPSPGCDETTIAGLRHTLGQYLGPEMRLEFRRVEDIPVARSGKAQYFISSLAREQVTARREGRGP